MPIPDGFGRSKREASTKSADMILAFLRDRSAGATASEVAVASLLTRSGAHKQLLRLVNEGRVRVDITNTPFIYRYCWEGE